MLDTKRQGNVTEVECMLAFLKMGYNVLTPYGDCERYDFVVDLNNKLYRIQVKKANTSHVDEGYIDFITANKTTKNGVFVRHPYTEEEIDFFMTFYNNQAFLIPVNECCKGGEKRLRLTPPKNGRVKGITFAKDYEIEKVVKKLINE